MESARLGPGPDAAGPQSLRERRKRELRTLLSDTATGMFLERGFDAVRVADVARACGVTEKTVFNHFPTKESLLDDRWDTMIDAVRARLAEPGSTPLDAALEVLHRELDYLFSPPRRAHGRSYLADLRRFLDLVRSTPSLVAHDRAALDRLTTAITATLAERQGQPCDDPEIWTTAYALTGLWSLFYRTLHHHLPTDDDAARIADAVRRDLRRAADLLARGL